MFSCAVLLSVELTDDQRRRNEQETRVAPRGDDPRRNRGHCGERDALLGLGHRRQKIDEIAGKSSELNTAFAGRLPDPGAGRPQPVHGVEPSRRARVGLDIWVARRAQQERSLGARPRTCGSRSTRPRTTSARRRSAAAGCFFVSRRVKTLAGSCGLGDIYFARYNRHHGWSEPDAPRLRARRPEQRARRAGTVVRARPAACLPLLLEQLERRARATSMSAGDSAAWSFGHGSLVDRRAQRRGANDIQPNVRKDGREIVFSSNHATRARSVARTSRPRRARACARTRGRRRSTSATA